jgi:hypothetical protein
MENTNLTGSKPDFNFRRMMMIISALAIALAAFANASMPVKSSVAPTTGTLHGYVIGGSGSGTSVPVGTPTEEPTWSWRWPGGCVHGPGYWREKPERWPVPGLTIGGTYYDKATLIAMTASPSTARINLIFHLVAAMINRINGQNYDGLDAAINAANTWLANPIGSAPVQELENFNYGHRGHIHCNDVTNLPDLYTYFCQVPKNNKPACSGGYFKSLYEWHINKWQEVSNSTVCMSQVDCQPPTDPNDLHKNLPCDPFINAQGLMVYCAPRYGIETSAVNADVSTTCPVNEVQRAPYPRALVNAVTNYFLQPKPYDSEAGFSSPQQSPSNLADFIDAQGNPTSAGYAAGIWKNFNITMRTRRFNGGEVWFGQTAPAPLWVFEDRSWNTGAREQTGFTANYTYKTSSAGLTSTGGRAYDLVNQRPTDTYNLPAYDVQITTSCGHEWKGAADVAQRGLWARDGECSKIPMEFPPDWMPDGYSSEGCKSGWYAPGHYNYTWTRYTTGWTGVDLVQTGKTTTYDTQMEAKAGGMVFGSQYWDAPSGIKVPVVEVQSVLRSACMASGTCDAPQAESDSVTH